MLITAELQGGGGGCKTQPVAASCSASERSTAVVRLTDCPRSDHCCGAMGAGGRRSYGTILTTSQKCVEGVGDGEAVTENTGV